MRQPSIADSTRRTPGAGAMLTELDQQARAFVEQRPVAALLAAIGFGIIMGRVAARY